MVVLVVKNPPANGGWKEAWVWSLGWEDLLEKGRQPTPGFLPGESHGERNLAGYSPWRHEELDTTETTLLSAYNGLHGKGIFKIMDMCMYKTDSLYCTLETHTTLLHFLLTLEALVMLVGTFGRQLKPSQHFFCKRVALVSWAIARWDPDKPHAYSRKVLHHTVIIQLIILFALQS